MNSFYILIALSITGSILLYFLLFGGFNLLKSIVEQTKGGLKGLCLIFCLTAVIYLTINRGDSDQILKDLQIWKTEYYYHNPIVN